MSRALFFQTCLFHSPPNRTSACPAPVRTSTKGLPSQVVMSFQEGAERFGGVFERFPKPVLTLTLMPLVNVSRCFGERTRTSYTEGCLSGGLSVCLFSSISCATGSTSPGEDLFIERTTPQAPTKPNTRKPARLAIGLLFEVCDGPRTEI